MGLLIYSLARSDARNRRRHNARGGEKYPKRISLSISEELYDAINAARKESEHNRERPGMITTSKLSI